MRAVSAPLEPVMLLLKVVVVYCLLLGVALWFGYRSRFVWPDPDSSREFRDEDRCEPEGPRLSPPGSS